MQNSVEKDEILTSEKYCTSSLEALQSPVAERVLYLALKETLDEFEFEFRDDDVAKIMIIFTKIIQGEDILDNEITFFQGVLEDKDFQNSYNKVINKIKFKDISFEELENLKEKISFGNLNIMLHKLIVKNKVSLAISNGETVNGMTVNFVYRKLSNYLEIDGKIYEKIGENVFKTTLDEEVKIFIKKDGILEEIEGIEDAEFMFKAETNIEGLENIVLLYNNIDMMNYIYNTNIKKIFRISTFGYIEKEGDKVKLDKKGRINIKLSSFSSNEDILLFDINSMSVVTWGVVKSFEYNSKEYYIKKFGNTYSLHCIGNDLSIPISNGNLHRIIIDEKKGIVKYKGLFGTNFGGITIDLSKL
ncbi:hypothetical protein M0P65_01160 [Candidatus Gracilibacteria bacterium]|nr:hypothetical protein [Candidatus Gracilibacteria bacterium]